MIGLLFFLIFVFGSVSILKEYHNLLDFIRDEGLFHYMETKKKGGSVNEFIDDEFYL